MSNSPYVNYTYISPNKTSGRSHSIDTITIHCVVGQCSVETLGSWFGKSTTKASSNYGIGPDGRIGMYVAEKDRSWCSSSSSNDNRAVTIEVASDTTSPYAVTDKAYYSLVRLVADICKRNGIKKLLWKNDKSLIGQVSKQNMTVHMWFANKNCPGPYLLNSHYDIASRVNKILDGGHAVLFKYMCGDDVKELQNDLIKLGYAGFTTADGVWGDMTETALRKFQTDKLGSADGLCGKNTWAALEKAIAEKDGTTTAVKYGDVCGTLPKLHILSKGCFGGEVKALQCLLLGYGYDLGENGVSGDFDEATEDAVEAFQTKYKIYGSDGKPDKMVGSKTWAALLDKLE